MTNAPLSELAPNWPIVSTIQLFSTKPLASAVNKSIKKAASFSKLATVFSLAKVFSNTLHSKVALDNKVSDNEVPL
ncbi:hypothetical protein G9A89_006998 [Geosiphon pyriformis]|nr:hypothetical protein G9A89_006998 [Geosiphon pyriformis]